MFALFIQIQKTQTHKKRTSQNKTQNTQTKPHTSQHNPNIARQTNIPPTKNEIAKKQQLKSQKHNKRKQRTRK